MASYTPNLNLYKPDSTDDFGDFRSEFNNNMDILDQGGGGSGDVVDVEVNGISVVDAGTKIAEITSYEEVTIAEYESIPVADRESNGIAYFIKDLNNKSVQGYPPLIYSDEEREVGVWIDGKPLYQKTTDLGSVSANASVDITVGIGAGVVETVVNISVIGNYSTTFWQSLPFPLPSNVSSYSAYIDGYKTHTDKIGIKTGSDRDFTRLLCTIKYTKTTDVAGSGTWNGQGGIAHHYSTNETVIGTWIDGKPLYERSMALASSVTIGTVWTSLGLVFSPDIKTIVDGKLTRNGKQFFACSFDYDDSTKVARAMTFYNNLSLNTSTIITLQYTKTTD